MGVEVIGGSSYTVKPRAYYMELKRRFNRLHNHITKRYISRDRVGCCSHLYESLSPESYQDFMDKYLRSGEKARFNYSTLRGRQDTGRTMAHLRALAIAYRRDICDMEVTEQDCLDDLIGHVIVETFDGHSAERHVENVLRRAGFSVHREEGDMDALFGVDMTVRNAAGELMTYLQVKPISTFLGDGNASLVADRANFFLKQRAFDAYLEENGLPHEKKEIEYVVYDGGNRYLCIDGRFRHRLGDLINGDGTTKLGRLDGLTFGSL